MNRPCNVTENDWELLKLKYADNLDYVKEKLEQNYPVQYLIGNVDFYGYDIQVSEDCLIPRFETEGLVEKTIKLLEKYNMTDTNVLEIGTGSGCIPIVLKSKLKDLEITSIDISAKAQKIAKQNIKNNNVDINLINVDMKKFKSLSKYGLIISNPPYIARDEEIGPEVKYEPELALFADHEGLEYYEFIIENYKKYLLDNFIMAFEIGAEQGTKLKKLAKSNYPDAKITVEKDLSGFDRYLFIINNH